MSPIRLQRHGLSPRLYTVDPSEAREMAGSLDDVLHSLQTLPGVAAVNDEDGKLAVEAPALNTT